MNAILNAWPFVAAAYAIAVVATAALLMFSLASLRRAEARAEALDRSSKG